MGKRYVDFEAKVVYDYSTTLSGRHKDPLRHQGCGGRTDEIIANSPRSLGHDSTDSLTARVVMKLTISEPETMNGTLWEGEALSANWDSEKCEFVIRADADDGAFDAVMARIAERQRLTVGIEDSGSTQVIWRGYLGSAKFGGAAADQLECYLTMSLDDWFGIFPGFSAFYFG